MANIERRVRDGKVRWYARHYDPSGNRHTKVFDTKAEADRFLTSVEMSKITGSYVDPNRSKVTVGVLADQWLEAKLDLAPKTRDRYERIIRTHIRPRWDKVRLPMSPTPECSAGSAGSTWHRPRSARCTGCCRMIWRTR